MFLHTSSKHSVVDVQSIPKKIGIAIKETIGIGDALQFSSLPENYFRAKGEKLHDISKPWFFDSNPFVIRDDSVQVDKMVQMWNFPPQFEWPTPRKETPQVYLSNAEIWASVFKVPAALIRPRLYRFEDHSFESRKRILLQTVGQSHGAMPEKIVQHILKKYYKTNQLFHIGPQIINYGLPQIETPTLWDLAELISSSRIFIGMDSGPSWIAACYPDVIVKKVRTKPHPPELFKDWIPLEIRNIHSHWDDRCQMIYNVSEQDIGFTQSYRQI